MALLSCRFYSETLGMSTSMTVILPQATRSQIGLNNAASSGKHKTLFLLHGLSDDDTIWARRTSIERYVAELGFAVIMPNLHRSFYTDMEYGEAYWTFLTEELPAVARSFFPLSEAREDNFVAGLSMGGYGAFKWALRHPERFAAAGSFSGALDIAARAKEIEAFDRTFKLIFGDKDIRGTDNDLLALLNQPNVQHDGIKPLLYQSCGTEDFLYKSNTAFRDACQKTDYELTYSEGPGGHDWSYWDEQIKQFLSWLPLGK
ncbi:alpha/beta hydrolase [Paenibacillus paeoniae]|uniref:Esterase family protein n=1 Tax=Paenibacillus paeoniae TaxID=2292705 RepID=A0A371PP21_9BACL|nr:alpha/beta hydrolase family protein [Paenibacillus paeoniae]REK77537.1 esterase family protein [Paenibacillus paeoniae]